MENYKYLKTISVSDIIINPENPRHDAIVIAEMGEDFIMEQLVKDRKSADEMYKLIMSLYSSGFIPSLGVILEYNEKFQKYIPWDGNRRITALKILQQPDLTKNLKYFTYEQKRTIYELSKKIEADFYEVYAYIVNSFEEAAPMIKAIHTTVSGGLPWDRIAIKRFENKLGLKNILTQAQDLFPKAFEELPNKFPTGVLEKLLESKEGKSFLNIENTNNILTVTSAIDETEKKITKIINDIKSGLINNKTVQNNKKIREYLYDDKTSEVREECMDNLKKENEKILTNDNVKNVDVSPQINLLNSLEPQENLLSNSDNEHSLITKSTTCETIKKDKEIVFRYINIDKLNYNNERAKGIKELCYEIQQLSLKNKYMDYPIAYASLLRSLLEQSSIYFLMNINLWEKLKLKYNKKDLKLEQIIKEISSNKENILKGTSILREWENCFNTEVHKDYFDLVIHHPYKVFANPEHIKSLSDIGLFAIIQYFVNN